MWDPYSCQKIEPLKCQSRTHHAVVTGHRLPSCLRTNYDSVSWEIFFSMCQVQAPKSLCF